MGFVNAISNELNKARYQKISLTAVDMAINSASTVDSDTDVYFFKSYDTASPSITIAKPEMDFLSV